MLCQYFEQPSRFHLRKANAQSNHAANINKDRRLEGLQDESITLNTTTKFTTNQNDNSISYYEYENRDGNFRPYSYIPKQNLQI